MGVAVVEEDRRVGEGGWGWRKQVGVWLNRQDSFLTL